MMFSNLHNDANSCSTTSNESVSWSSSTSYDENKIRAVSNQFLTHKKLKKRKSGAAASKVKQAASSITSTTKYMNTPKRRSLFMLEKKKSKKILANKNRELEATTTNTTTATATATPLALTNDVSSARLIYSPKINNKMNTKNWIIIKTEAMQNAFFIIGQYLFLVLAVVVMFQIPFVILGFAAVGFIQSMAYTLGWVKFIFAVNDYDFEDNSAVRRSFMRRMNSRMFTYAWLSGVGTAISLVEKKVNSECSITELKKSGTKSLIKSIDERIESFNPKAQN